MHDRLMESIEGMALRRTLVPLRRLPKAEPHPVVLGMGVLSRADGTPENLALVAHTATQAVPMLWPLGGLPLTPPQLLAGVRHLLGQLGLRPRRRKRTGRAVYLVMADARAALSTVQDALAVLRLHQGARHHHARLQVESEDDGRWTLHFLDASAFLREEDPEVLSSLLGLDLRATALPPDVPVGRLAVERPDVYQGHAVQRADLVLRAFLRLRAWLLDAWGVEALHARSVASLASVLFRYHHVRTGPAPITWHQERRTVMRAAGYRDERRQVAVFAGDPEVRRMALRAYSAAASEAYGRGLLVQPVREYDADSLYPYSAILQPQPHERTRWRRVKDFAGVLAMEGYGTFDFRFPADAAYPCLPVHELGVHRQLFPRSGRSHATFAEARVAHAMGAQLQVREAYGFEPGERERNHDLAAYMRDLLTEKRKAKKGTLDYLVAKLFLNALIGKLMERYGGSSLLDFEREGHARGLGTGFGALAAGVPSVRRALQLAREPGAAFAPEWASLTLGRAKSLMAELAAASSALHLSTDALIVRAGSRLDSIALAQLRAVGSDMRLEVEADALFVSRTRLYALLARAERVPEGQPVLARDGTWAVLKVARHGTRETHAEFAETLLASLAAGSDHAPLRRHVRRLAAEAAVRMGAPLNAAVAEERTTRFTWDGKRRLLDRDGNPFRTWMETAPYDSLGRLQQGQELRKRQANPRARRRTRLGPSVVAKVLEQLQRGASVREVARRTGVARSTVHDLKQAHQEQVSREREGLREHRVAGERTAEEVS